MSELAEKQEQGSIVVPDQPYSKRGEITAPAGQPTNLMQALAAAAADPRMDIAKVKELWAMHKEMMDREARNAYNESFALFKAEAIVVVKNRGVTDGPLKGKRYAELYSVVNAVTPLLSKYGLSHSWQVKSDKDTISVTCTLKHPMGHSESVTIDGPPDAGGAKNAIQARASTITYLERYTLKAVCGIAEQGDDDDGRGANGKRLADNVAADHLSAIDASTDDKELLSTYANAHKAAIDAEDMGALRLFTQHKDARKKALRRKS